MSQVMILSGGSPHAHDFEAIADALVQRVVASGHTAELFTEPDGAATELTLRPGDFDALVVHGLWWRMHGDAYDDWRGEHGYSTPISTRDALVAFVNNGGGLVALHTAPICFDDWPEWGGLVGGAWQWGISSHPPAATVTAQVTASHPVVAGLGATIELRDEVYGDLRVHPRVNVLATARRHDDDADQPVVWTHQAGHGRVVFDGFGHDRSSIFHEQNGQLIDQALNWVCASTPNSPTAT